MTERSEPVTWILWLFLGILGVHRLYLGQFRYGLIMAAVNVVLFVVTGGFWLIGALIWWAIEATQISASVREANRELRAGLPAATSAPTPQAATPAPPPSPSPPPDDTATRLRELKALRDEGIITEEEYESRRLQLVQRL